MRAIDTYPIKCLQLPSPNTRGCAYISIVKLLWLSEVLELYSPIAWFVALNTSFKDQTIGSRVFRLHPEPPCISYVGAEADDWPSLRFHITWPHRRRIF